MSKRIVLFGNTPFSASVLETLNGNNDYEVIAWTNDSNNNPVTLSAKKNDINLYMFNKQSFKESGLDTLKNINPDLCIVIAYGRIIPESFLSIPKYGFINIHGSTLPDLRGATPIQTAILKGYSKTGATIQRMVYKMDEGDILKTYPVDIDINDNFSTLREKMSVSVNNDLQNFLNDYFSNNIDSFPQDDSKATYCYIKDFSKENGKINWDDLALNIHNKIRAFYPEPIAWSIFNEKNLNFIASNLTDIQSSEKPGTMFARDKKLYVSTNDNDLEIIELVMEGKKPMKGIDFANGILRKEKIELK